MMNPAQLKELTPNFSWEDYRRDVGAPTTGDINVAHPEFFQAVNKMLTEVPVADWKTYLRWHLITAAAPSLSSKFEIENFNFFGKTLEGRKEQLPRWRRCVSATDASLGEALGQVYVARAFTPESKARMQTMVNNLIAAFREHLHKARLDERRNAQAGHRQARRVRAEDWLSRQVDRLLGAQRLARFVSGKRAALQLSLIRCATSTRSTSRLTGRSGA